MEKNSYNFLVSKWIIISLLFINISCLGQQNNISEANEQQSFSEKHYYELGRKYNSEGFYKKAIELLSKAIQKNPNYLKAYILKADVY